MGSGGCLGPGVAEGEGCFSMEPPQHQVVEKVGGVEAVVTAKEPVITSPLTAVYHEKWFPAIRISCGISLLLTYGILDTPKVRAKLQDGFGDFDFVDLPCACFIESGHCPLEM